MNSDVLNPGEDGVRRLDENCLPRILALYSELHPEEDILAPEMAEVGFRSLLLYPGSGIFAYFKGGNAISTCTLIVVPNLTRGGKPYSMIENVVTSSDHRRMGYGAEVLRVAIASAWDAGCYKVMLLTGSKDPSTLRFYKNVGFEQSKTGFQIRNSNQ